MMTALHMHLDRWVLAAAALSWAWMLGEAAAARRMSCCEPLPTRAADFTSWMLMVAAMMLPTTTPAVRDVATRSYRSRRPRAVLEYLVGYMGCWLLAGVVFVFVRTCPLAHDLRTAATLCVLAAAWAVLPAPRSLVRALPPADSPVSIRSARRPRRRPPGCGSRDTVPQNVLAADVRVRDHGARPGRHDRRYRISHCRENGCFACRRTPLIIGCFALAAWILVRWLLSGTTRPGRVHRPARRSRSRRSNISVMQRWFHASITSLLAPSAGIIMSLRAGSQ